MSLLWAFFYFSGTWTGTGSVFTVLTALTIHYSLHSPSDMNILFWGCLWTQQMLSHQHLTSKESFAQHCPLFLLSLSLSLNVFFFLLHGSSGSSVHYVLGKQPGQRARGGGGGRGFCSLPRHGNSFGSDLSLPSFDLSNTTCM